MTLNLKTSSFNGREGPRLSHLRLTHLVLSISPSMKMRLLEMLSRWMTSLRDCPVFIKPKKNGAKRIAVSNWWLWRKASQKLWPRQKWTWLRWSETFRPLKKSTWAVVTSFEPNGTSCQLAQSFTLSCSRAWKPRSNLKRQSRVVALSDSFQPISLKTIQLRSLKLWSKRSMISWTRIKGSSSKSTVIPVRWLLRFRIRWAILSTCWRTKMLSYKKSSLKVLRRIRKCNILSVFLKPKLKSLFQ